jgi:hypothetical protein
VLKTGSLKVNDGAVSIAGSGLVYTFTMPASDVTVSAEFDQLPPDTYSISVTPPANGTVNPDPASAVAGAVITLTVTPDAGYALKDGSLKVNDGAVSVTGSGLVYTFTMPASDVPVRAEFEAIPYLVILPVPSDIHGTVTGNPSPATIGDTVTLTVTPDAGYALKDGSLKVFKAGAGNESVEISGSGSTWTFTMPASSVYVDAIFNPSFGITIEGPGELEIPVTVSHSVTGSVTGPAQISWTAGESLVFTVEDPAYTVEAGNLVWMEVNLGLHPFDPGPQWELGGNSLTINAEDCAIRTYNLTVMIKEAGQWFSTTIPFKVVD